MGGFRLVALGYALLVLLIAPTWLSAGEVPSAVPAPVETVEEAAVAPGAPEVEQPELEVPTEAEPKAAPATAQSAKKKSDTKEQPVARAAASGSVTIRDFAFDPTTITVNEGDTVTWTNEDSAAHTATADDGSFDTGMLRKGESGSATFTSAGTISYICTPHPNMKGTVVVQAASAGSDGGGGGGGGSSDTGSDGSAVAGDDAASTGSGSSLPATGAELLSILLLGLATLGYGLLLRGRANT